ncbi:MAG: hypothetical protein K9K82_04265 [Desulfobacteraceae bacterium]|nr:hypothetical protein [Desulfobacteraceae bacterium]
MKTHCLTVVCRLWICVFAAVLLGVPGESGAVFYKKNYEVKRFQGHDVLCDPYTVWENDYVIKILKQRGDIAHKDFPRFLEIFNHINPDVKDVDLIYPQQRILIPLRILEPGTLKGQKSGKVSIPVVTITNLPRALKRNSEIYEVSYGDSVSRLIADRFGRYGSDSYKKGVKLFRKLNPDIEDLDRIRAGTEVRLPNPDIRNQPWYDELFENLETENHKKQMPGQPPVQWFKDLSVFARAARIVDAELLDEGYYFFPRKNARDFGLDLSSTPVIELKNGRKLLFARKRMLPAGVEKSIRNYWENLEVVFASGEPELSFILEKLINSIDPNGYKNRLNLDDNGILVAVRGRFIYNSIKDNSRICLNIISEPDMRTPTAVCDYLAGHDIRIKDWVEKGDKSGWVLKEPRKNKSKRKFQVVDPRNPDPLVRSIAEMLGWQYHENVEISFPYAGFQVKATTSMLSLGDQAEMLVDYGSLQGGAVETIEKNGFKVLQIQGGQDIKQLIGILEHSLPVNIEKDPMFWTANRPRVYNTSIQIPGWLVSPDKNREGSRLMLSVSRLASPLVDYLHEDAGIKVIHIRR